MNRNNIDIIYLSLLRTDNGFSSVSLSLAKELSKTNRVFYINHPYSLLDVLKSNNNSKSKQDAFSIFSRKEKSISEGNFESIIPPTSLPINWIPQGAVYDRFYKLNENILTATIQKIIRKNDVKEYIFINCFDPYYFRKYPITLLKPLFNIYHCVDDIGVDTYTIKHGIRLENETIKNADIVMVTSSELKNRCLPFNKDVVINNNAVDISIFRRVLEEKFERPKELEKINTKIIGFVGNLDHLRIDYELLKKIALFHHDKSLVLIGPLNNNFYKEAGLDKITNIHFLGSKNIQELPQYLQYMDCTIIPFLKNKVTKSIYPLKINEYLGAGRAVIATDFSEDILSFEEWIYIGRDHDDFLNKIDIAIQENNESRIRKRLEKASKNTWSDRVVEFWEMIEKHLVQKNTKNIHVQS
jgi:teichuronic acid biosynthesis glycosyltransferase TuaH